MALPIPRLGHVDDALEGEIVVGLVDGPEIGHGVADLAALVEARPADHAIGQTEGDETLFEFAGLKAGSHQDRDVVETMFLALQILDHVADDPRLFLAVPDPANGHFLARLALGPQGLAEATVVARDQTRGGGQDVAGRAVIAFEADDAGAGKIALELEDVADLGAAPAVDRLVVVTDAADVAPLLGEQAKPQVLGDIGVLVLVDEEILETFR